MAQAVWARHDITTLKHDLQADPVVVVGTYDGSWVPKSLLLRPQRTSPIAAGFPVKITPDDPATDHWLVAPLAQAAEVKRFEAELRATSRRVSITITPLTKVIRSIEAPTGLRLDLDHEANDELWDPTAGLSI